MQTDRDKFNLFPKHLFHEKYPPIIAHNSGEEAVARTAEYGDTYIEQEFPKMVHGKTVNSAEEEKQLLDTKIDRYGNVQGESTPNDDPKRKAGSTASPLTVATAPQPEAKLVPIDQPSTPGKPDPGNRGDDPKNTMGKEGDK